MIRRPPRSTRDRSSAASDVYKRQGEHAEREVIRGEQREQWRAAHAAEHGERERRDESVSYTHLRAHETVLDLVCRLLLEKKTTPTTRTD